MSLITWKKGTIKHNPARDGFPHPHIPGTQASVNIAWKKATH
jgi:hypothetical protein